MPALVALPVTAWLAVLDAAVEPAEAAELDAGLAEDAEDEPEPEPEPDEITPPPTLPGVVLVDVLAAAAA